MKSVRFLAVLAAALLVAACKPGANAPAGSGTPSADAKPVATVDGTAISRSLYDTYAKGVSGKDAAELIAKQAEKDGLAAKPETAAMLELSRLNILQQEMMQKYLADKTPTDQELRAEYETQVNSLSKQEYHARHILVATEDFAKRLIVQLDKGANFEKLAARESIDSSKTNGGDLGWLCRTHGAAVLGRGRRPEERRVHEDAGADQHGLARHPPRRRARVAAAVRQRQGPPRRSQANFLQGLCDELLKTAGRKDRDGCWLLLYWAAAQ